MDGSNNRKVEIWHSVLRSFISNYDSASQIRDKALSFAASKTEQLFHNYLTTPYSRGYSEKDLSLVTGTAADALLKIIKQVGQNLGKAKQVPQETNARGQPKGDMNFFLPTFDTTITSKAMPLGYSFVKEDPSTIPDPKLICDYKNCTQLSTTIVNRLNCFHTFHNFCLEEAGDQCPICSPHLAEKIAEICSAFNESLLKPTAKSTRTPQSNQEPGSNDENDSINVKRNCDPEYYDSAQWESHIDSELNSFVVAQPQLRHNVPNHQAAPSQAIDIQVTTHPVGSSTFWFFPPYISQSTLLGRNGSNAFTFISLILAHSYITSANRTSIQLSRGPPINPHWLSMMLSAIVRGNSIYDTVTNGRGSPFFSVVKAKPHLDSVIGTVSLEDTLDLLITSGNPQVLQSSLAFYLQRLDREQNLAAIVIANGMTISLVGHDSKIYVLDSHLHYAHGHNFGAMIGMSPKDDLEEFLRNIKKLISPKFDVCSLTFVSFSRQQ
ncbi:uncharacterized protein LOC125572211 [Nematostella vectensis]|uniref:uncharacterized protein LOC125572211 n=1 Tax=Nematostella vectensis TaxID=45351 RepID=UPI00207724F7|nr:uncharacterized protein LOC125572211 [Nematostella vectensis]